MAHHVVRDWGYFGNIGPSQWPTIAPDAAGSRQSPIVIVPSEAVYDSTLRRVPFDVRYGRTAATDMLNHGRSVQINVHGSDSVVTGGPLHDSEYQLKQFHFHWGSDSTHGSEHVIGARVFPGELHLVHWNRSKFDSVDEALKADEGICVLAVFLQVGDEDHAGLENICCQFASVQYAGDELVFPEGLDPSCLLPGDISCYWTYSGSLTTPPCFESVRFIVLKEPIQVSERQLNLFRSLKCDERCDSHCRQLVDNFRPPMPLNGRQVSASFRKFFA